MQDLTSGSSPRHLFKTAGFMLVTMLFQTLYFLVDLYWVGRLGKEAVAAVALCGNLTFIVFALTQMLSVGTTTAVSHAVGRHGPRNAGRASDVATQAGDLNAATLEQAPNEVPNHEEREEGVEADAPEQSRFTKE